MTDNLAKLADVLAAEYELYQKVYDLAEQKQELIMDQEVDKLEEIVQQEEEQLETIQKLENTRQQLVGEKDLSQLIAEADQPTSDRLEQLQDNLLQLTRKLQDINQLNGKLLDDALQLTNISLNILGANQQGSTYGKQGTVNQEQSGSSMINHKA
ncbi:flagellar protein FlgN [Halanaerobaculum tunisiense]